MEKKKKNTNETINGVASLSNLFVSFILYLFIFRFSLVVIMFADDYWLCGYLCIGC